MKVFCIDVLKLMLFTFS